MHDVGSGTLMNHQVFPEDMEEENENTRTCPGISGEPLLLTLLGVLFCPALVLCCAETCFLEPNIR